MKKTLKRVVSGVEMNINIEALAKGVHEMHIESGNEMLISFGMLSAPIMNMMKENLTDKVKELINTSLNIPKNVLKLINATQSPELMKKSIDDFVNECMKEITVNVYSLVKMVA
jgi:hypothetical protein